MKFTHSQRASVAAAALALAAGAANAVGTDFTTLTAAVDFSTVVTAVIAIGAILMVPKVAVWGTRKVLSMIRG